MRTHKYTVIASIVALLLPILVSGDAVSDLVLQIQQLQQQIQAMTAQRQAPQPPPGKKSEFCPRLTRVIQFGSRGSDVESLQIYFASVGLLAESNATGYFGVITERAVQNFQTTHKIVTGGVRARTGFGVVGPRTREALLQECNGYVPGTPSQSSYYNQGAYQSAYYSQGTYQPVTTCTIDGTTIQNGESRTFYSARRVPYDMSCLDRQTTRTCVNGVLTGTNYQYLSCVVDTADSCSFAGVTIESGTSRVFYRYDNATSTNTCGGYSQTRFCNDGVLSGDAEYNKTSCSTGVCQIDGITMLSGSSTTFYLAKSIPASEQCTSYAITRTCNSGTLDGNSQYKYASCSPISGTSCVVDSLVVASGNSATFYSTSTPPAGGSCGSYTLARTCTNGTLSGAATYNRSSCFDQNSCSLDGLTKNHGESAVFYNARTVAFGTTCSSISTSRTCVNGAFNGAATHAYASCTVNPPTSSNGMQEQLASAYAALAAALQALLALLRQ